MSCWFCLGFFKGFFFASPFPLFSLIPVLSLYLYCVRHLPTSSVYILVKLLFQLR